MQWPRREGNPHLCDALRPALRHVCHYPLDHGLRQGSSSARSVTDLAPLLGLSFSVCEMKGLNDIIQMFLPGLGV